MPILFGFFLWWYAPTHTITGVAVLILSIVTALFIVFWPKLNDWIVLIASMIVGLMIGYFITSFSSNISSIVESISGGAINSLGIIATIAMAAAVVLYASKKKELIDTSRIFVFVTVQAIIAILITPFLDLAAQTASNGVVIILGTLFFGFLYSSLVFLVVGLGWFMIHIEHLLKKKPRKRRR